MSYRKQQSLLGEIVMVDPGSPLLAFSDHAAELVERTAGSVVAVEGGGRWPSSGIHWRSGIIVTAEEALERDEDIKVTFPGGRTIEATLTGRDPTTDVAVLRFQPDGLPRIKLGPYGLGTCVRSRNPLLSCTEVGASFH